MPQVTARGEPAKARSNVRVGESQLAEKTLRLQATLSGEEAHACFRPLNHGLGEARGFGVFALEPGVSEMALSCFV